MTNTQSSLQNITPEDRAVLLDLHRFGVTRADLTHLERHGKTSCDTLSELNRLAAPRQYPAVIAPSLFRDGNIKIFSAQELEDLNRSFLERSQIYSFEKIVPAGGAATRQTQLLKTIYTHSIFNVEDGHVMTPAEVRRRAELEIARLRKLPSPKSDDKANIDKLEEVGKGVLEFWEEGIHGKQLSFYGDLEAVMANQGLSLEETKKSGDIKHVCSQILKRGGLNYESTPKLLMKLHTYAEPDGSVSTRTALEEHLREAAMLMSGTGRLRLHFIVSPEHERAAEATLEAVLESSGVKDHLGSCGFSRDNIEVSFSLTDPKKSCVALSLTQPPKIARDIQGNPVLGNPGHGSVLSNVSNTRADGVWLKNVDNVLYENPSVKDVVVHYMRAIAALGSELQGKAHEFLAQLQQVTEETVDPLLNIEICEFLREQLQLQIDPAWMSEHSDLQLSNALRKILDRPIVVGGFVPLEHGQVGGGPFMIEKQLGGTPVVNGNIVEQAEFAGGRNDPVFESGEFFNPVLLFIAKRRPDGGLYELQEFSDPDRSFIAQKGSPDGSTMMATIEYPGLWNGGIKDCIQVSVAFPSTTFSAIKKMVDFLTPRHQPREGSSSDDLFQDVDFERGVIDHTHVAYFRAMGRKIH